MAMKIESMPASMTTDVEFRGLAGEIQQIFTWKIGRIGIFLA